MSVPRHRAVGRGGLAGPRIDSTLRNIAVLPTARSTWNRAGPGWHAERFRAGRYSNLHRTALIIARMPVLIASGRVGHAWIRSASRVSVSTVCEVLVPRGMVLAHERCEISTFLAFLSWVRSPPLGYPCGCKRGRAAAGALHPVLAVPVHAVLAFSGSY